MTPTIIFDFDGTLAVGDGPVLAYARAVAAHAAADYFARVELALDAYGRGETAYRDGYDAVASLAREDGVAAEHLDEAYRRSRELLGQEAAPVDAAPGLRALIDALDPRIRLVLATNAPEVGIPALLARWGIADRFAETRFAVGKPAGLEPLVREALARGPVLAVGDIDANDLEPARRLGADTALVGATAASSETMPTLRATTLAQLAPGIQSWAQQALDIPAPSTRTNPTER